MSYDPVSYINRHQFVPHVDGNSGLYGLSYMDIDSTITFKNEPEVVWRFISFTPGSSLATYVNRDGVHKTIPCAYNDEITRMQAVLPDSIPLELETYLIDLYAFRNDLQDLEEPMMTSEIESQLAEFQTNTYGSGDEGNGFTFDDLYRVVESVDPDMDGMDEVSVPANWRCACVNLDRL
jgi:hypothetical protein